MDDHILHVFMNMDYPKMVRGEGIYLYDEEGNKWIDSVGGPLLVSLGYGNKELAKAAYDQLGTLSYVNRFFTMTPALKKACDALSEVSGGYLDRFFTVSGGTEAVETAMKLAKTYQNSCGRTSKYKVLGRWNSYHGMSNSVLSVGGHLQRRAAYQQMIRDDCHVSECYCYRCPYGDKPECCRLQCAEDLERQIIHENPDTVAAFIMEPVSGNSLCAAYPENPGYFKRVREICDKYDVVLIFDEVMNGMGRTGDWFAFQGFEGKPDIVTMGKAISGGYFPVGAVGCTKEVYETIKNASGTFGCGFSWAGNPTGAAVISKTIEYMKENDLINNIRTQGAYLKSRLEALMEKHPTIGDVRGKGLQWGLELVKDKETKEPFPAEEEYWRQIIFALLKRHMLIQFGDGQIDGHAGDMLLIGPAFTCSAEDIDVIVDTLDDALTEVERSNGFDI